MLAICTGLLQSGLAQAQPQTQAQPKAQAQPQTQPQTQAQPKAQAQPQTQTQELMQYATKNGDEILYDKGSVREEGKGVFSFINVVRMSEENAKKYSSQQGYSDVCHKSMQIMAMDCGAKSYVIKKVVDSDKSGKILNSIDPEDQKFKPIVSGSAMESLQAIICK
ncbi:surface-adhesin E family protein [Fundidesulfovibrio soli]|uniref:surface-adhesin E family protein n=1 Tax=Fundidesulfovibrio soli TaxID=2922716 RepID=UPI001FAE94C8|nr:surface-adhesin E family protein [Fundidesulfovibrio soli]